MSAIVLGPAVLVLAALGGWRLWVLHRSVASAHAALASVPKRVDGALDRFWDDVQGQHVEHADAVEARVRRAEATVAQLAREHGLVARHVSWMAPWVRHWASLSGAETEAGEQ